MFAVPTHQLGPIRYCNACGSANTRTYTGENSGLDKTVCDRCGNVEIPGYATGAMIQPMDTRRPSQIVEHDYRLDFEMYGGNLVDDLRRKTVVAPYKRNRYKLKDPVHGTDA